MGISAEIERLKQRRTKIVATLGPASGAPDIIERLIETGANVFRLNLSHGTHALHAQLYERVREAARKLNRTVAVLADLAGPRIRTGAFEDGAAEIAINSEVTVTPRLDVVGSSKLIPCRGPALGTQLKPGDPILIDNGRVELRVETCVADDVVCRVVRGGLLLDHRRVYLPGSGLAGSTLTAKDREDAEFALALGVDLLALSSVRSADDVNRLGRLIAEADKHAAVLAKIEEPEALEEIDAIIAAADGIVVARGDLGVTLPTESLPLIQEQLIEKARDAHKPVVIATQVLESMMEAAHPTRAEVSDVAHAVGSGVDALMLSGETAAGAHPVEAASILDRVARQSEAYQWQFGEFGRRRDRRAAVSVEDAVSQATANLSRELDVRAILTISDTGRTARMVSAARPAAPILAVASDPGVCRRMSLLWGVVPTQAKAEAIAKANALGRYLGLELGLASPGDKILVVRGFHGEPERNAPSVTVVTV